MTHTTTTNTTTNTTTRTLTTRTRGVTPVLGLIIIIAVVTTTGTAISIYALTELTDATDTPDRIEYQYNYTPGTNNLTLTYNGSSTPRASTTVHYLANNSFHNEGSDISNYPLQPGETVTLTGIENGTTIFVRHDTTTNRTIVDKHTIGDD